MKKAAIGTITTAASLAAALLFGSLALTGCSSQAQAQAAGGGADTAADAGSAGTEDTGENNADAQTILCGVVSGVDTWGNVDENGDFDGFEPAVLREIDRRLPQYVFELQPSDFNNILLSLDSGKIDLGTHMFEYSRDRAEKYLFADEGYFDFTTVFVVPVDSGLNGYEDFAGKTVGEISKEDASALVIQDYNEKNPDKAINLDYYGSVSSDVIIQSLLDGRWDALISTRYSVALDNQKYGNGQDIVKEAGVVNDSNAFYLYPKDGAHEALKEAVDGALKEMKEDGTLAQISIQYIGSDVTPKADNDNARSSKN